MPRRTPPAGRAPPLDAATARRPPTAPPSSAARSVARRRLGVGGLGDRAHDRRRARAPAATHGADRAGVDAADREPRQRRVRGRVARRARARPPGGPAWSASRAPARRRCSRRRSASPASTCAGECVDCPTSASAPTSARASATGRSSWPTWTPSAPAAATRSGRSLRMNSAPARAQRARGRSRAAARISSSSRVLVAQLEDVDAAAQRAVEQRARARAGARRGTGARRRRARRSARSALTVWQRTGGSALPWSRNGSPSRAERAAPRPPTVRS